MKKVIVTGGSRGIGRACVELFAENGYAVAFIYRFNDEAAEECADETGAFPIKADISDPEEAAWAYEQAVGYLGGVDVLINNAGISESELSTLFAIREETLLNGDGAGLGLYVSQGIVRAHGGSMLVESRDGKGTRVRVMLPASRNLTFRDSDGYPRGPGLILTELSTVLGRECYDKRYRD